MVGLVSFDYKYFVVVDSVNSRIPDAASIQSAHRRLIADS